MPGPMNLVVLHGGGPTAVANASLCGILQQWQHHDRGGHLMGARFGTEGLLRGSFVDLDRLEGSLLQKLARSPGAALGSSRRRLDDNACRQVIAMLRQRDLRGLIVIGGNGSMAAAHHLAQLARSEQDDLCIMGVPQTVDNDVAGTDRCPGYASAARFVAQSARDVMTDVQSLPVPVCIFETMGRGAGWLAAAAALAGGDGASAPHGIYVPELPFDLPAFLTRVDQTVRRQGWVFLVVSEGLRDADGRAVYCANDAAQHDEVGRALPGGVGSYLADQVASHLKLRCRSEKPGLCGRSSLLHVSPVDRRDAESVAARAVDAIFAGQGDSMAALAPYRDGEPATLLIPLDQVVDRQHTVPHAWLDPSGASVADEFLDYLRPLIGPPLLEYHRPF